MKIPTSFPEQKRAIVGGADSLLEKAMIMLWAPFERTGASLNIGFPLQEIVNEGGNRSRFVIFVFTGVPKPDMKRVLL